MYKKLLKWVLWSGSIVALSVSTTEICSAHNNFAHHHNGRWHSHPHNSYHYHNNVVYYPHVQWFSYGTNFNVGPVIVSPNRRYVRMGINFGFSSITGYSTFNLSNGRTQYFRK